MTPQDETRKLRQLEHELERTYPQVPADKVRTVVEHEWMRYLDAPVRDFVPLLVGREVRGQLRHLAG